MEDPIAALISLLIIDLFNWFISFWLNFGQMYLRMYPFSLDFPTYLVCFQSIP
jgi:hypothetical protein